MAVGDTAPDWTAKTLDGKEVSLKQSSNSPIMLVFSEIACVPCQLSIPNLNKIHEKYPKLIMIGIYPEDSGNFLKKYITSKKIMYPVIPGAKDIGKEYLVDGYPTFFLIGLDGKLNKIISGYSDDQYDSFCKAIDKISGDPE